MSIQFGSPSPKSSFSDSQLRKAAKAFTEVNTAKTPVQANKAAAKGVFHWVGFGLKMIGKGLLPNCIRP